MICNICKHESLPKYNYKDVILYKCTNSLCRFIQIDYDDQEQKKILTSLLELDEVRYLKKPSTTILDRVDFFKNYFVGKNIVDLGSGCARYEQALDRLNIKYNNMRSVDFWDWAIEFYKSSVNKTVFKYDVESVKLLDLGIGAFNFIIASHIIEHVNNPLETLKMWSKLLDKDGYIFIEVPDISSIEDNGDILFTADHLSYFNPDALDLLLRTSGFDIIHKFVDPKGYKHGSTIVILGRFGQAAVPLQFDLIVAMLAGMLDKKMNEIKDLLAIRNISSENINDLTKKDLVKILEEDIFVPTISMDNIGDASIVDVKTSEQTKDVRSLAGKLDKIKDKKND